MDSRWLLMFGPVNTFACDLSSYLADVLSPLTGKSEYKVNNSAHFVSTINGERVLESEIMVSFDVESLFTNVPIGQCIVFAVHAALRKLEADPCLANGTTLTPTQIADLLDFVLRSTYFQYNGLSYEQQEGAAMGSPVSAVIANLYMEDFEEQTLTSTPCMPKIWKRYVDDTFTILSRDKVDIFLQHLNSQQRTIRFTMETETNNTIPFLDTLVTRDSDGYLSTMQCLQKAYTH